MGLKNILLLSCITLSICTNAQTKAPVKKKKTTTTTQSKSKTTVKKTVTTQKKTSVKPKPVSTQTKTVSAKPAQTTTQNKATTKQVTNNTKPVAKPSVKNEFSTYSKAFGLRINPLSTFDLVSGSFKMLMNKGSGIEANLGFGMSRPYVDMNGSKFRTKALSMSVAYQHHFNIPVPGLKWYGGAGATGVYVFTKGYSGFTGGVFPTLGVDYKFSKIPLNVSTDYRPTYVFGKEGTGGFAADVFGIAVRYTL